MTIPRLLALTALLGPALGCSSPQTCDADCAQDGSSTADTSTTASTETSESGTETGSSTAPDPAACMVDQPIVVFETSMGTMVMQLDGVRAPITVANFVAYVTTGFYDGTIFHRVEDNFVIQGGGFAPGLIEKQTMAPIPLEIHPELRHVDGALSMARTNDPNSATSQFFITDGAQPLLDDQYAVFGVLIDGFDVRDAITNVPVHTVPWMTFQLENVPVDDILLNAAYCVEAWP